MITQEGRECKVKFDWVDSHKSEVWYVCKTCGAKDWFSVHQNREGIPSDTKLDGCKYDHE